MSYSRRLTIFFALRKIEKKLHLSMVALLGFEPRTPCLKGRCSRLRSPIGATEPSHSTSKIVGNIKNAVALWGREDSNLRPLVFQTSALRVSQPSELLPHNFLRCDRPESNQRHLDFQSNALPTELRPHILKNVYKTKKCFRLPR